MSGWYCGGVLGQAWSLSQPGKITKINYCLKAKLNDPLDSSFLGSFAKSGKDCINFWNFTLQLWSVKRLNEWPHLSLMTWRGSDYKNYRVATGRVKFKWFLTWMMMACCAHQWFSLLPWCLDPPFWCTESNNVKVKYAVFIYSLLSAKAVFFLMRLIHQNYFFISKPP